MKESYLQYDFEELLPSSDWVFITPSPTALSMNMHVQECGHFFQTGRNALSRGPLDSYNLTLYIRAPERFITHSAGVTIDSLRTGDLVWLDCAYASDSTSCGDSENAFLHFNGANIGEYYRMFLEATQGYPVIHDDSSVLRNIILEIIELSKRPSHPSIDIYVNMLLTDLVTNILLSVSPMQPIRLNNPIVARALEMIRARLSGAVTLEGIAGELRVNSSYLSRLITKETGAAFSNCLAQARVSKAKELLRTTDKSLEAISGECGFYNASHLIKQFKKYENLTPGQYRSLY